MAWLRLAARYLTIDVQFGDPSIVTVVGNVRVDGGRMLIHGLDAAASCAGRPLIDVNLVFARFQDEGAWLDLLAFQKRYAERGGTLRLAFGGRRGLVGVN